MVEVGVVTLWHTACPQWQHHRYLMRVAMEQHRCLLALFSHRHQVRCPSTTQAPWAPTALTKGTQTHGGGKNALTVEEVAATHGLLVAAATLIDHLTPLLSMHRWHSTQVLGFCNVSMSHAAKVAVSFGSKVS